MDKEYLLALVAKALDELDDIHGDSVITHPDERARDMLAKLTIDEEGTPVDQVIFHLAQDILPYRIHMEHKRTFAFIPSPVEDVSYAADLLLAMNPTFGASYLQGIGNLSAEECISRTFTRLAGFGEESFGVMVSGGSMGNFASVVMARDRIPIRRRGNLSAYASEETHSSIQKALRLAGAREGLLRKIPVKDDYTMDTEALEAKIAEDHAKGFIPFYICGNLGSTNTGAVDDFHEIGRIAAEHGLYFHIDGAYGGAMLVMENFAKETGAYLADSISIDAHKWLGASYVSSLLLAKKKSELYGSFHTSAEYLTDADVPEGVNPWELTPEMTRPARAVKLYAVMKNLGLNGMRQKIEKNIADAELFEKLLRNEKDVEIISPAHLAILNFRFAPEGFSEDEIRTLHQKISKHLLDWGYAMILTTTLKGMSVLRICTISPKLTENDIKDVVRALVETKSLVLAGMLDEKTKE